MRNTLKSDLIRRLRRSETFGEAKGSNDQLQRIFKYTELFFPIFIQFQMFCLARLTHVLLKTLMRFCTTFTFGCMFYFKC